MRLAAAATPTAFLAHAVLAGPPSWYNTNRFHAHTRLPLNEFCQSTTNCTSCTWSKAVTGVSPGSTLLHNETESFEDCKHLCCINSVCEAVIYRNKTSPGTDNCVLLNRQYNGSTFAPAHNSLVANVFRSSGKNTTNCSTTWACAPVFEEAAERFASLGVPAYVRHSHTSDEGMLWPTQTAPREGWHQIVQDTNRNFPAEFLSKADKAGINVILYHYMKTNAYWAKQRPDWLMRWPNGSAIEWQRGLGLSPCSDGW